LGRDPQEDYIEAPGFSGTGKCTSAATCTSVANIAVLANTIDALGVMTAGTFNGVDVRTEERYDKMHTEFDQLTVNSVDHWSSKPVDEYLLGVNASNFANPIQTTLGWDNYNVQGFSYAYSGLGSMPTLNFGSGNLSPTGPWVLTGVRQRPQTADNSFATVAETAHYDWSSNLKFTGGASFKEYAFKTTSLRLTNGKSVGSTGAYASLRAIPLAGYGNGHIADGVTWFGPSVSAAMSALGLNTSSLFTLSTLGDLGNNFSIKEKDTGAFVQADFVYSLLGHDLRGNIGMRGVRREQHSNGYQYVGGVSEPGGRGPQVHRRPALGEPGLGRDRQQRAAHVRGAGDDPSGPDLAGWQHVGHRFGNLLLGEDRQPEPQAVPGQQL
jgi:hypothetical protein